MNFPTNGIQTNEVPANPLNGLCRTFAGEDINIEAVAFREIYKHTLGIKRYGGTLVATKRLKLEHWT